MKNVMLKLYIPSVKDYWYEEKLQGDKDTMSYNAGYDVSYFGYHYETGCIDFPKSRWQQEFERRIKEHRFFAYLQDENQFVGYVNYQFNHEENRYECGIVIDAKERGKGYAKEGLKLLCDYAKKEEISSLYDEFEVDRPGVLVLFNQVGFRVVEYKYYQKFHQEVKGVVVKINLL